MDLRSLRKAIDIIRNETHLKLPVQTVSQTTTGASGRSLRSTRSRLRNRRFSGRVKRPVRPHLDRRGKG